MSESNEEWELSKENIQPIQQGRKQKVLKTALAPHPEDLILQERQAFEHELRTYSGDDPLSVWCKYIKWVEQNFPKGGREGHIKHLIEQCLAILRKDKKYYDDDRFIDILLKFANMNAKPLDVYNYMYSHNIGCKSAKFFISWSWELEQLGNLKTADQVLTEGIQRQAVPFETIQSYRRDFETRLACKIKEGFETNNFESDFGRSAFAMLKPQKKNLAPISRIGDAVIDNKRNTLIHPRQDLQSLPRKISAPSKVPFKIYNSENVAPPLPVQSHSIAPSILHSENYKENEQKPSKWNKAKIKPRLRVPSETNPGFKFHCDDDNDNQETYTPRSIPKTSSILSVRCRTPSPVMALFEPPDPMKKAMYPKDKVYGGAEEYSLEEIRAAQWFERKKKNDQELMLEEQKKLIQEQAKKEEELKKKIENLTKQVQLLQTNSSNNASKAVGVFSTSEINCSNENPKTHNRMSLNNTNQNDQVYKTSIYSENSVSSVRQVPSYLQNSANNEFKNSSNSLFSFQNSQRSNNVADIFENEPVNSTACQNNRENVQTNSDNIFSNISYRRQVPSCPVNYANNESDDISKNVFCLQNFHKSNHSLTDTYENKCTDSTSYREAAKMVQELYNGTLSHPRDESECKPTAGFSFDLDNKSAPSSNICSSDSKEVNHTAEQKSDVIQEIKNDLPFEFFHDPTEVVSNLNNISSKEKENSEENCVSVPKKLFIENGDSCDEDAENVPPKEYVQEKSKRELAGILEPSKNILFIPLEEQELQDDSDIEDDLICQPRYQHADETLVPPSNTEQFSTAKFDSSTPCVSRRRENKTNDIKDEIQSSGFNNIPSKISLNDENNQNPALKNPASVQHATNTEEKFLSSHSVLPKVLSVIMETTENSSKSSSSSSCSVNLTKSGHLDPSSSNFIFARKPFIKHEQFDRCSLSCVTEVPDSISHVHTNKTDVNSRNQKQVSNSEEKKLFSVDFDPFDPKETHKLIKSVDFNKCKKFSSVPRVLRSIKIGESIKVGDITYIIERLIAEGAYAKVFEAVAVQSFIFEGYSQKNPLNQRIAVKVCKNSNEWEFYICCEIEKRLAKLDSFPDIKESIMNITSAIKYTDGIVLLNEYSCFGTLLDLINFHQGGKTPAFNEYIVMYLTYEILHIVSTLHELNIIHGDIKPDNFLLKNTAFQCNDSKLPFETDVSEYLSKTTCLKLIDFGRAIDLNHFEKGICFTKTFSTSHFKCTEMKENKPWVFQLDWYGVLSCIHTMLFSEYMVVVKKNNKWQIEKKFKRYWFCSLWEPLFTELLNIPACYQEPNLKPYINLIQTELQKNSKQFLCQFSLLIKEYSKGKK